MSEINGLDLFGGHALEEIPEDNNLPIGEYEDSVIDSAKVIKSKNGPHGVAVNFKDISEDGFGLTAFKWIGIPAPADKARYLLKDLKSLTLNGDQLLAIARGVKGTDPETAEVDIEAINDVLADVVGVNGHLSITGYVNKRTGAPGQNVDFKPNEDDVAPTINPVASKPAEAKPAEETANTDSWFA